MLTCKLDSSAGEKFEKLVSIMARLRAPDGCPWDREQTFDTIKPYTLEETYEVLDAIDARDWPGLTDELGDFMLQAVFYAQMASEAGHFRIEDCLDAINNKLIRRHPHIFGDSAANTADDVKKRWDEIKSRGEETEGRSSRSCCWKAYPDLCRRWWKRRTSVHAPHAPALIGTTPSRCC